MFKIGWIVEHRTLTQIVCRQEDSPATVFLKLFFLLKVTSFCHHLASKPWRSLGQSASSSQIVGGGQQNAANI